MKTPKVKTTVNLENQETTIEVLADSIKSMSDGIKKLRAGRLNDKALFLLIQHASTSPYRNGLKVSITEIKSVLGGIADLERTYLK